MKKRPSDAEVLSRFVVFQPPPSGFDAQAARPNLLRKHGFPRRPDALKEPRLFELWQKAFSRPMKVIKAELAVNRVQPERDPRRDQFRPTRPFDIGRQWAAATVNTTELGPERAIMVYGQWIVPSVVAPERPLGPNMGVGFWVGLGGDERTGSKQLVQAGTRAEFANGNITYSAFAEWWPAPPVNVMNFPVQPGDHVEFLVCSEPGQDHAFVSARQLNTGTAINLGITAPQGFTSDGITAEWAVDGYGPQLLDFLSMTFGQCLGSTANKSFDLTTATTSLISSGNTILANVYLLLSNAAVVNWYNYGP